VQGQRVELLSGTTLGVVCRVLDDRYQVEDSSGARHWLLLESIYTSRGGLLTLVCEGDGLARYMPLGAADRLPALG
jgi:hypothetical protein